MIRAIDAVGNRGVEGHAHDLGRASLDRPPSSIIWSTPALDYLIAAYQLNLVRQTPCAATLDRRIRMRHQQDERLDSLFDVQYRWITQPSGASMAVRMRLMSGTMVEMLHCMFTVSWTASLGHVPEKALGCVCVKMIRTKRNSRLEPIGITNGVSVFYKILQQRLTQASSSIPSFPCQHQVSHRGGMGKIMAGVRPSLLARPK